jgi:hypothetical protein
MPLVKTPKFGSILFEYIQLIPYAMDRLAVFYALKQYKQSKTQT